jgi:hypothetical protein
MPQSLGDWHALGLTQCDTVLTLGALHMGLLASCKLTPTKRGQLRCERHIGASTLMRLWHIWPCCSWGLRTSNSGSSSGSSTGATCRLLRGGGAAFCGLMEQRGRSFSWLAASCRPSRVLGAWRAKAMLCLRADASSAVVCAVGLMGPSQTLVHSCSAGLRCAGLLEHVECIEHSFTFLGMLCDSMQ